MSVMEYDVRLEPHETPRNLLTVLPFFKPLAEVFGNMLSLWTTGTFGWRNFLAEPLPFFKVFKLAFRVVHCLVCLHLEVEECKVNKKPVV